MTRFRLIAPAIVALLASATLPHGAAADPQGQVAAGGALFKQRCAACHSVTYGQKGIIAPNLAGVVGRKAASADFAYSPALKASGLTWSTANLDRFLAAPMKLVPGTRMVVAIADPADRANVIAWLATRH